ncbi:unnamed protein product [Rotaria sordida]|uniref:F-box domain-containing protein n=1 Tax=Rotaria sordida TaxID=392033 RepID=A0A819N301_9BILA|nr:unnamed protein product [Rotaria sordida]
MLHISTFEHLPNELIVRIFSYLKPEENFYSFFNCNDRLRKLVKRHVLYSRRALNNDIKRLSKLHNWYKHLDYVSDGVVFHLIPLKGEQARNGLDPRISDESGIHWHFWKEKSIPIADQRIQQIIEKYPIKLNPLFYPGRIFIKPNKSGFNEFIRRNYASHWDTLKTIFVSESWDYTWTIDIKNSILYIQENESKRMKKTILEAADRIWKELQELEDINIIEIQYQQQMAGFGLVVQLCEASKPG